MSAPPPDPRRFEGCLEHVEAHAGPFTGGEGPELEGGGNRGYGLVAFESPGEPARATVVSTGLRFADREGDEAMLRRWAEADTPLDDVERESAV